MMAALNRTVLRLMKSVSVSPLQRFSSPTQAQPRLFINHSRFFALRSGWEPATREKEELSILAENIPPENVLTQSIKSATNTNVLLNCIEGRADVLKPNVALLGLRNLFQLYKYDSSTLSKDDILANKNFEVLCKAVRSGIRLWSPNNLIEILKIVLYFGVPVTSIMVQSVLHILKKEVNDLNISEIIFLHMLCEKSKPDANIKALEIALPLVFEANIKLKLKRDSMLHISEALDYCTKYKVSAEVFDDIVTSASKLTIYDERDAMKIARGCSKIPHPHPLKGKLCSDALDFLVKAGVLEKYSEKELHFILDRVTNCCKRDKSFYNAQFFESYVENLIRQKESVYRAMLTADRLRKAHFVSQNLLDYICEQIIENPEELKSHIWLLAPFKFVNIVVLSGQLPKRWAEAENVLMEIFRTLPEGKVNYPWIRLASNLVNLGSVQENLISHIFEENYLNAYLESHVTPIDYLQILNIYQHLKIFHPDYAGPLPSSDVIDHAVSENVDFPTEFPLQKDLEAGFGGSEYVLTKVCLKLGLSADHVVVIRKGGYPVALNLSAEEGKAVHIENMEIPLGSQLLPILYVKSTMWSHHHHTYKFGFQSKLKYYAALGYKPVLICEEKYKNLSDHEKVAYLMQNVKESAKEQFDASDV